MKEIKNKTLIFTVLLMLSANFISAFPFDESNYKRYLYTKLQIALDDTRYTSEMFPLGEYSFDGTRCISGNDPTTRAEVLIPIDNYNFETTKGDLKALVKDQSGEVYISESYTIVITEDKDLFGAHLYFTDISTTLCIIRSQGKWYGSWVYFTN